MKCLLRLTKHLHTFKKSSNLIFELFFIIILIVFFMATQNIDFGSKN